MKKLLIYITLLLILGATALGYLNYRRYKAIIAEQSHTIQQQRQLSLKLEEDLKSTKETLSTEASDQEKNKNEVQEIKKTEEKAINDLTEVQKQLAAKEEELTQVKGNLAAKTARAQELEAQQQAVTANKKQAEEVPAKHKKSNGKTKAAPLEHKEAPLVNHKEAAVPAGQEGKVLAVNQTWNFIVINLGDQNGILNGSEVLIKKDAQVIAKAKITSVEPLTSVADLISGSLLPGTTVQVGDLVTCVGVDKKDIGK